MKLPDWVYQKIVPKPLAGLGESFEELPTWHHCVFGFKVITQARQSLSKGHMDYNHHNAPKAKKYRKIKKYKMAIGIPII
jgi:hypothetical protein